MSPKSASCAVPECQHTFLLRKPWQRFCSVRCRRFVDGRRYRQTPKGKAAMKAAKHRYWHKSR